MNTPTAIPVQRDASTIEPLPDRLPKLMYSVAEAAPMLGMSEAQVRRLCREKIVPSRNTGKAYFISANTLLEYAKGADAPERMRIAS
ncbi:helix-turn-helix domain-containing protein [Actinosynnema sp. NPDC059335]|uniref:helix-turn-helix domain-containing protein n=1 Tax=Actinosynnema sp. NPDC059335 TaxID=3346804 RepID=UPI00366F9AAF